MKLVIDGEVKSILPSNIQGIYQLQDALVNNYPHWNQKNGENSIWFGKEFRYDSWYASWQYPIETQRRWFLGPRELLGYMDGYIIGPKGIDQSPTRITKGWEYFYNEWKEVADSEIVFQDLSPSGLSSFLVILHLTKIISPVSSC